MINNHNILEYYDSKHTLCIYIYIPTYSYFLLHDTLYPFFTEPETRPRQTESRSAHPAACAVGAAAGVFLRWNPRLDGGADGTHGAHGAHGAGRGG